MKLLIINKLLISINIEGHFYKESVFISKAAFLLIQKAHFTPIKKKKKKNKFRFTDGRAPFCPGENLITGVNAISPIEKKKSITEW